MLRGAIDNVHHERVGGWLYSDQTSLRGATVLAFVDDQCVGSGTVAEFRKDLVDVGLGDGYLGFTFPISLPDPSDTGRLTVRLENSDAVLLPAHAKVSTPPRSHVLARLHHTGDSVEWMRSRGWLDNMQYTSLKYLTQLGVFEYSLVTPKSQTQPHKGTLDAKIIATDCLSLLALSDSPVQAIAYQASDAPSMLTAVTGTVSQAIPVVAILAEQSGALAVVEGSHNDRMLPASCEGAISYPIGPDRLLFVNLLCALTFEKDAVGIPLTIFATSATIAFDR